MQTLQQHQSNSKSTTRVGDNLIQPKLKIGQPGDKYEQEADRVADTVMRMPEPQVQMQPLEEEEELQMKQEPALQMKCKACEEREKLRMMPAIQQKSAGMNYTSAEISSQLNASKGHGNALSPGIQHEMSHKIGDDFSEVNIHTDFKAVQMNQKLGAKAFTHGKDIYFNRGEYNPASSEGKHLLAHELAHVVQQKEDQIYCKKDEKKCPKRQKGEKNRSKNSKINMYLASIKSFVRLPMRVKAVPKHMTWLLYDFAIGEGVISAKKMVPQEDLFAPILKIIKTVEANQTYYYNFKVTGFSDCRGGGALNQNLRMERAWSTAFLLQSALNSLSWPTDRNIKVKYNSAGVSLANNSTEKNRGYNRSGAIVAEMYKAKHDPTPLKKKKRIGKQKLGRFLREAKRKLKKKKTGRAERLLCIFEMLYDLNYDAQSGWHIKTNQVQDDYFSFRNVVSYLTQLQKAKKNGWQVPPTKFAELSVSEAIIEQAYRAGNVDSFLNGLVYLDEGIVNGNNYIQRQLSLRVVSPDPKSPLEVLANWIQSRQKNKNHFYNCYVQKESSSVFAT